MNSKKFVIAMFDQYIRKIIKSIFWCYMAYFICSCANQYQMMFPVLQPNKTVQQLVAEAEVASCCSSLFSAAKKGHKACAKACLEQDPTLINEKDLSGYTALDYAASGGKKACVELLLNNGAAESANNTDVIMPEIKTEPESLESPESLNMVDPEARIVLGDNVQKKLAVLKSKGPAFNKNQNTLRFHYRSNNTSKARYEELKGEKYDWLNKEFDYFYNKFFLSKEKTYRDDLVEIQKVGPEDSRVLLHGQDKLIAKEYIPAYTVLGIYVGKYLSVNNENNFPLDEDLAEEINLIRDGVSFGKCYDLVKELNSYAFNVSMWGKNIMVSGYGRGNPLIKINAFWDYKCDPQDRAVHAVKINVERTRVRFNKIEDGYLPFIL
ncbi:ankyrin repeat domain-containing protein, partial [Candidatus Cardinium hertigii]